MGREHGLPARPAKNIYLRRGGYWFSRMRGGKRRWVNLETRDPIEAQSRAADIAEDEPLAPPEQTERLMWRFLAARRASGRFTARTEESTGTVLRLLHAHMGNRMPRATSRELQAWLDGLRERLKPATVEGYRTKIRGFYRWLAQERIRHDNPCTRVHGRPVPRPALHRWANPDLIAVLIGAAPNDDLRFALYCGFHAGLRRLEISEARVNWFDLGAGLLHVRRTETFTPKDRDERTVELTREFRGFLAGYLAGREPDDFAMLPEVGHGRWRYRYDFRRPFELHCKAQGAGWLTIHGMRHSFASNLASAGVSIFKVAEWLGDGVAVVQRHYARLAAGDGDIELAVTPHRRDSLHRA